MQTYISLCFAAAEYMMDIEYSDYGGSSTSRHSTKLISPPVIINETSCLRINLISNANLNISTGFLSAKSQYQEKMLLWSPFALGPAWQRLNIDLPPSTTEMVFVYSTSMNSATPYAVLLKDVTLLPGKCRQLGWLLIQWA